MVLYQSTSCIRDRNQLSTRRRRNRKIQSQFPFQNHRKKHNESLHRHRSHSAKIDRELYQFTIPKSNTDALPIGKHQTVPAFDAVRASVNLMLASIIISIATSWKMPLSTTYVTFMVAMGTSLSDRAWGSESAVYRVAGVLNVIGGWFFTAFCAFTAAALCAFLIYQGGIYAIIALLLIAAFLLTKNFIGHKRRSKEKKEEAIQRKAETQSVQGVINESAATIAIMSKKLDSIYSDVIINLAKQQADVLKKTKKTVTKLSKEVESLQSNIYYFINNLDESSVGAASNFHITQLSNMEDVLQPLKYITDAAYNHVNNNHRKLTYTQLKELKNLDNHLEVVFTTAGEIFAEQDYARIAELLQHKSTYIEVINDKIAKQVARTRTEETSPKNTTLYFALLTQSRSVIKAFFKLIEQYYVEYDASTNPKKLRPTDYEHQREQKIRQ